MASRERHWIPACAGMTTYPMSLDFRLRGNDELPPCARMTTYSYRSASTGFIFAAFRAG
jgi:hypothetical protein